MNKKHFVYKKPKIRWKKIAVKILKCIEDSGITEARCNENLIY